MGYNLRILAACRLQSQCYFEYESDYQNRPETSAKSTWSLKLMKRSIKQYFFLPIYTGDGSKSTEFLPFRSVKITDSNFLVFLFIVRWERSTIKLFYHKIIFLYHMISGCNYVLYHMISGCNYFKQGIKPAS